LKNGIFIRVTPFDHIEQQIFWYGHYEQPVAILLENIVKPDSIVLDIGANIGYFTLIAAQKAKKGKVVAFEPVQELSKKLQQNIRENHFQNIKVVEAAAGESEKDSTIYLSTSENSGMSSLQPPENFSGLSQAVKIINIDQWIKQSEIEKIDIVKLDIEGSELFALRGMKETLINFKPFLIVEINKNILANFSLVPGDIMNYLTGLGYISFDISEKGELKKYSGVLLNENAAFVHSEKLKEFDLCFYNINRHGKI